MVRRKRMARFGAFHFYVVWFSMLVDNYHGGTKMTAEHQDLLDEIERLRAALKRIAGGWPKPMQLARETLEKKK